MNKNQVGTIIFTTILVLSIYTIPNQIGDAYGHQDPAHSRCWDRGFNLIPDIISFGTIAAQLVALAAAFLTAGASLSWVPAQEGISLALKILGWVSQVTWVSICGPQIIAPPSAVAGASHLECNDEDGFVFTNISSEKGDSNRLNANTTHSIIFSNGEQTLPDTIDVRGFKMMIPAWILFILGLVIDFLIWYYPAPNSAGGFAKAIEKQQFIDKLDDFPVTPANTILRNAITGSESRALVEWGVSLGLVSAGRFDIFDLFGIAIKPFTFKNFPDEAISGHPFRLLENSVVGQDDTGEITSGTFSLGKNTLLYKTEKKLGVLFTTDTDEFPINVYDNESPTINFGSDKNVIVEANTHYGFNVDSKSLSQLQRGISADDNCDTDVEPEYVGPSFFLVSSIKANQYAPWKVEDKGYDYWALTALDANRTLAHSNTQRESIRTAQIDPNNKVEFAQAIEGSTLRHLTLKVANSEINKLIEKQLDSNQLPPTADNIDSGELIDFVTDDKISIVGVKQEEKDFSVTQRTTVVDSLPEDTILGLLGLRDDFDDLEAGELILTGIDRSNTLDIEDAEPNIFVDFQYVTVIDTIPPSISDPEDLAVVVNSTHPESTDSQIVDADRGGCTLVDGNYSCALKIEPPAIFDIADPFPVLYENFTQNGTFKKIEEDLIGDFPLGVSTISWKAVDFSENGNQTNNVVTQFVNLKLNGTNIISKVFDVSATVFSTVPQQITLIANNTDQDPLKFLIEGNPSKGILDTPIDAVFLTKFQQLGTVSKLKGITNEGGNDDIFFTDSRHERVLTINAGNETLVESFVGPLLGTPVAISKLGDDFIISDWSENKIIRTTDNGTLLQTFNVQGLFETPDYLTVDQNTEEIYVTDSLNGTISILSDFDIFLLPKGIEVDNSDTIYVADEANVVKVFDSLGVFIEIFGSGILDSPTDITVDSHGNIYVLETDNDSIKNFTSDRSFAIEFSSMTSSQNFFNGPEGITTNGTDIFVADTLNHQVKKLSSFTPQIQEFYNDTSLWTQSGTRISIHEGKEIVEFNKVGSGTGEPITQIFRELGTILDDSWSAEFKIKSGQLNNEANAFIWLLTNNTQHPQNVTSQNVLGVIYDEQELKIFQRHGDANTTSTGISLPDGPNKDYFVSFDKIGDAQAAMVVFDDEDKTTQIHNGNVTHLISNDISDLHVLQHSNDIINGNGTVNLDIDDTVINPLLTWLGKCDSGPNCIAGISNQFTCTDTTCFGSGAGSLDGQFDLPKGISANSTHLFVADYNNNRTQVFDVAGNNISNLNVTYPTDVEYSNSSKSTVVSSENQNIVIFQNDGNTIEFGEPGDDLGDFSLIAGLGIDSSGKIYVSDLDLTDVQVFEEDGDFIEEWQSSINARFGDYIEIFQLYLPGIQAGALDAHDEIVMIGDWREGKERVIVANSKGGNLTQHDISQITPNPHSIAFTGDEIFISDPSTKKIVIVDKSTGDYLRNISALNDLNQIIMPTGITINNITEFPGEKIYVFDNGTEKIFSIKDPNNECVDPDPTDGDGDGVRVGIDPDDNNACNPDPQNNFCLVAPDNDDDNDGVLSQYDPDDNDECIPNINFGICVVPEPTDNDGDKVFTPTDLDDNDKCYPHLPADLVFNAKNLFTNLNDIAVNNTHVFGLDSSQNKSSIIQIRWDKGIQDDFSIDNVTGVAMGKGIDSNLLFYTSTGNDNELSFFNRTDNSNNNLFDLTSLGINPSGIATVPNISGLVNVTIKGIDDPRGLAFSPDNQTLYVSDFGNNEIKVYNATTNNFIESISHDSLSFPTDLVFGPEGNLFVASFGSDSILAVNVTNNNVTKFAGAGDFISRPVGLAVSLDDTILFVSSSLENKITRHALEDIDETVETSYIDPKTNQNVNVTETIRLINYGDFLGELVNSTNRGTLANPQDIAIGPDYTMYASSFDSDEILHWSIDGTPLGVFGQANKTQSDLDGPSGIKFSPDGTSLFVSSVYNNQVLEYDGFSGQFIEIVTDEATMIPDGLALRPNGNLLVSSIGSGEILEYGKLKSKFYVSDWSDDQNYKIYGLSDDGTLVLTQTVEDLSDPQNIASDSAGKIWIADKGSSSLVKISPVPNSILETIDVSEIIEKLAPELHLIEGSNPQIWTDNFGKNYTSFVNNVTSSITPKGISLDKNDNLYVTDWNNHRIVQLDKDNIIKGQIKLNSTFTGPMDLAINHTIPMGATDQNNIGTLQDIWIFDSNFDESNNGQLISLDAKKQFRQIEFEDELSPLLRGLSTNDTTIITTPSNSGSLFVINSNLDAHFDSKHFIIPSGIDLDINGIYVSDWKEKRIVNLDSSSNFDREFDFKGAGWETGELGDMEVSEDKKLFWITEPNRAVISEINFTGTFTNYISVADKYVAMAGVDSDLDDNFYILSTDDTSIKKFDLRGRLLGSTGSIPNPGGTMNDIALGPVDSESIFLATTNKIIKFNSTSLSDRDEISTNFNPSSVAVDNSGNIYVSTNTLNVTKYDQNLSPQSSFLVDDVEGTIEDMVIDSDNNLYAADSENHRVYKYNLTSSELVGWLGKCDTASNTTNCITESLHSKGFTCDDLTCFTNHTDNVNNGFPNGRDIGQFFRPNDLAVDGLDNIYVSDIKLAMSQSSGDGFSEELDDGSQNVPRVQKFSQEGFFVKGVISDRDNTLVEGNFDWVKAIAYGKNNFYVVDVDKLHVFDVSPFRNIQFDPSTQNTTAQVIYESLVDIVDENDNFLYAAFDGFDKSSNIGTVNLNITNPDIDGDGLFGNIDLQENDFSNEFESSVDGTSGEIMSRGDQILIVREARDSEKGLYIQADIRQTGNESIINLCDDLAEIVLSPGDRLVATCTLGEDRDTHGVEIEVIRGEVMGIFYDDEGRESTFVIPVDNTIFFGKNTFEFISGEKNFDTITQNVTFNGKTLSYTVPPDSTVQIDTKPPVFATENCPAQLVLEAESIHGVTWNRVLDAESNLVLTGQFERIKSFFDFKSTDEDNGNQHNTDGSPINVTNNAPYLFRFGNTSISLETEIEFFTVDKMGNNATCSGTVIVKDTVGPILEFGDEFTVESDGLRIENTTGRFSETGRVFWNPPKVLDLPLVYEGPRLEVDNSTSQCSFASGSSFKVSPIIHENSTDTVAIDTMVVCSGKDLADNWNDEAFGFNVRITLHDDGLRINKIVAADNPDLNSPESGLNVGDTIWVEFTMPTNQPKVSDKIDLDAIFDLDSGNFGNNVTGSWVNPSSLLITINDISSPLVLSEGITEFDLKSNTALKSAGGLIESSGTLGVPSHITLDGTFSKPIPPFIEAFVANDPELDTDDENASSYSEDDTLTIRFSEPTNCNDSKCKVNNKNQINNLFSFSEELGERLSGVWQNPSTLVITVNEVNNNTSMSPILGTTTATVIGDIRNEAKTSNVSQSTSPPLSGNFGQFYVLMDINENSAVTETLPSGITLGINFPNGTTVSLLEKAFISNDLITSEMIEATPTNSTIDCEMGCDVTFWIHSSELEQYGVNLDNLRILHDEDNDDFISSDESLIPEIKEISINLFSVTVKLFSFSSFALGADIPNGGGGGGGDSTAPEYQNIAISGGGSFKDLIIGDIKFDNNEGTASILTGEEFTIIVDLYENSGIQNLQHISLYMNILGFDTMVHQSDTFIRWDKGLPVSVNDPHGYFLDADVELFEVDNKIQAVFTFTFAKPMEASDVIIRAWDIHRNSADVNFRDFIEVTGDIITVLPELLGEGILEGAGNYTPILTDEFMDKWAGFSSETISDDELLMHIGLEGNYIPEWFKETTAKWFMEEKISEKEFIDALEFLSRNLFLYPS